MYPHEPESVMYICIQMSQSQLCIHVFRRAQCQLCIFVCRQATASYVCMHVDEPQPVMYVCK